ncbi:putative pre-16S rRNA nuclease [bioreactor metagenome]|uniref:Putative pre-16S rRNA nuclease n=1 Tax=bioreactor metagenome TaxID=1076179 RepID=A0A645J7X5_9ZZZZ
MQAVLGIDFGKKRIGTAINFSDMAEPLEVVANEFQSAEQPVSLAALQRLREICQERRIEQLVVGVSEQEMAGYSRHFGQILAQETNLPVAFVDETLTSREVAQRLLESGASLQKRQGPIDHFAAALILEAWLDQANLG